MYRTLALAKSLYYQFCLYIFSISYYLNLILGWKEGDWQGHHEDDCTIKNTRPEKSEILSQ